MTSKPQVQPPLETVYLLRDDSRLTFNKDLSDFVKDLAVLIGEFAPCRVVTFRAEDQIEYCQSLFKNFNNVLSLDKFFKGDFNLLISRVFGPGKQTKPSYYNIENINEFKKWLDGKDIINIVDDDIASGGTISAVLQYVNVRYNVFSLDRNYITGVNVYDICDVRDFIPGSLYGGLMLDFGGGLFRHPYIEPNVCLETRMKITGGRLFSEKLKQLWIKYGI